MPRTTWIFLAVGVAFAITHAFASYTSLYWYYPNFDIVMHFWGGVLLVWGLFAVARAGVIRRPQKRFILGFSLTAILGWEFFEQIIGVTSVPINVLDTITDIFVGLFGVMVAYLVLRRSR